MQALDLTNPRDFRSTLGRFATGVTVVTTAEEGQVHGMTANAFMSVSLEPPLVLVSVDKKARTHAILERTGRYGVSILAEEQLPYSNHFAGKPDPNLPLDFEWVNEIPLLPGAVAHLVTSIVEAHPAGDHTLFIGRVEYIATGDGKPLLFYGGKYGALAPQA